MGQLRFTDCVADGQTVIEKKILRKKNRVMSCQRRPDNNNNNTEQHTHTHTHTHTQVVAVFQVQAELRTVTCRSRIGGHPPRNGTDQGQGR